jgi:putative sporulation protein YyaC
MKKEGIGLRLNYKNDNTDELSKELSKYIKDNAVIVCIGTDKCIGDALAPIVGTMLQEYKFPYPVYGTLEYPTHAINLEDRLKEIKKKHPNAFIIAIDACLGHSEYIGDIQLKYSPVHPGKGVGKQLPEVGDISIVGVVDSIDVSDIFSIRSIRLFLVHKMAKFITQALIKACTNEKLNKEEVACS